MSLARRAPPQVETSWRAKDASKTKELDAAQAKIARLDSQLKSALAGAPLPAGVEEGQCVIAVEELEALRAHGGGVRNAELQIKLEGKIDQVKSLQQKMTRMEATYAEQLAAKSAELHQQLNDAAALRTDFDAIQVRSYSAACRHTARPTPSTACGACGERMSSEPRSSDNSAASRSDV